MSEVMEEEIRRWTARRKSALVLELIHGKTTLAAASRQYDLPPAEIESWVEGGKRDMESALCAKSEDVREQYERQLKDLEEAAARPCRRSAPEESWHPCWERTRADGLGPAGPENGGNCRTDDQAVPVVWRGPSCDVLQADQVTCEGET